MSMMTGPGGKLRVEMNVTPMIDVLLVLLVIFILITPLKPLGYVGEVPQKNEKPQPATSQPDSTIVLQIISSDFGYSVQINQEQVQVAQLESRLTDIYKQRAEKILFIKADSKIDFLDVADVMDTVKRADKDIRIGLLTGANQTGV